MSIINSGASLSIADHELAVAIQGLMEAGGFEPFLTQTALLASVPTLPKKAAKAMDTKKIWYWNGSGWVDTGLSELDQANARMDANPLFKPVTLTTETITNIVTSGNYLQSSSANATIARGYPEQITGKLTVIGVGNYVFYTYETTTQNRYSGVLSGGSFSGWTLVSAPDFFAYRGGLSTANLNTRITQGWFVQSNSANSTLENNYPVVAAGRLDVFAVSATSLIWQRFTTITNVVYMRAYNGTLWSEWAQQANKAATDTAIATSLNDAKSYTDIGATNLFKKENNTLFPSANLTVRRYLATGELTDYAAGTYQTTNIAGLTVAVTPSGSNAIKHYFKTGLSGFKTTTASFKINTVRTTGSGEGVGVGCIDESGNYIAYVFTESGNVYKLSNGTISAPIATGLGGYIANDTVKVIVNDTTLTVLHNGVLKHTSTVPPLVGEVLIGQVGFSGYLVSLQLASDPIRNYVNDQIAASSGNTLSPAYYSFNPTGGANNAGQLIAYTQVKGNTYVGFTITREVDASDLVYKNYWRIVQAKFYTLSSGAMADTGKFALGDGESEFVFKQNSDKDDFTGGYHGDEQVTSIKFLVDGLPISLASTIPLTACKQVEYIEVSTMHETAQGGVFVAGHPKIADHIKHTRFLNGGYKTFNRVTWNFAGTLSTLYHGISCIHKDVASAGFTDGAFAEQVMTGSGTQYFNETGARLFDAYNVTNGYAAQATSRQIKAADADAGGLLFVHDRSSDSKYYRKSPAKVVASGEVVEAEFSCQFFKL